MDFQRFGNAFVAQTEDTLYVVSIYGGGWCAYYRTAEMDTPEQITLRVRPAQAML